MSTAETPRFHIPFPAEDDKGMWWTKFSNGMTQADALLFGLLENQKAIMKDLPSVIITGPDGLGRYWFTPLATTTFVSRTLMADIVVSSTPLQILPNCVVGLTLTPGAIGTQSVDWELFTNTVPIDVTVQAFGYVNTDYSITWFNASRLSVGAITGLFAATGGGGGTAFLSGAGNPNGVVTALAGTSYYDTAAAVLYMNIDSGTTWVLM
jgi:hypothetical protein